MEELIRQLEEVKDFLMEMARLTRDQQRESFRLFKASEVAKKAAEELKKMIPKEMELEGGGKAWWYVCPECHGAIDRKDSWCRHCGQAVK